MKTLTITLFFLACSIRPVFQKTEKLFGVQYQTKVWEEIGDYEIWYVSKQYYNNNKNIFGIHVKGVRNDTVVMVAKKQILADKIIVTEVYKNVENIDSIVRTMHFKNGVYLKSTYKEYYNSKRLPNRININDPEIQKLFRKKN